MIKKLSLYGLCFNLGVAFGAPLTQEDVEAFISTQGGNIEVKRTPFGLPYKIVLKDKDADIEEVLKPLRRSSEDMEPFYEEGWPTPVVFTPEERRASFEKYSRETNDEERALVAGWGVKDLRIVDFDSIINGLDDEAQKQEARTLMANEVVLAEAIDNWAAKCHVGIAYWLGIFVPGVKYNVNSCCYVINPEIIESFRKAFRATLHDMARYQSTRETLVLALVLLKDRKISIDCSNVDEGKDVNVTLLYDELNHELHRHLGIEGHCSITGELDSTLERDLFRLGNLSASVEPIRIPLWLLNSLLHENYYDKATTDLVEIPQQKFYRMVQMSLLWESPEEIWHMIGFANVEDAIYVNRMSLVNLIKTPVAFAAKASQLADLERLLGRSTSEIDMASYPLVNTFLKDMKLMVMKDLSRLCPTLEAWKIWLRLQRRSDADIGCFTVIDKTMAELMAFARSVKLLGGR